MSFKTYALEDVLEITSSKRIKMADYVQSGIPFYRSKEIIEKSNNQPVSTDIFITCEHFDKIKMKFGAPEAGDILLTSVGTLGVSYQVSDDDLFYFKDGNLTWFRNFNNRVLSGYIYCWLKSPSARKKLDEISIGTTQRALTIASLKKILIKIPSLDVQKKIVFIYESLSKKIINNGKINQTLEQMAQVLFKSWFVDFEPVKAKIAVLEAGGSQEDATRAAMTAISGKDADALVVFAREHPEQYAELKATAELFPSAMQDSELGEIPAGWRTAIVESVINRLKVKNTFPADCIKLFGQHPVLEQGAKIYQGYHDEEPSFNASLQSPMFIFGDHTCVMHLSTVPFDISKNTLVLKGKIFNTYWTFFALKGKQKFQEYKRHWSDLKVKQVVIPDENNGLLLTNYFASKCENLFGLLEQNRKQNLILQNTRDTLLPKLLSGEITLPEAEQIISEEA